jgi:hypothetical protein
MSPSGPAFGAQAGDEPLVLSPGPPATGALLPEEFASLNTGAVMDVPGSTTALGAPIVQWPWNGGANQKWSLIYLGPPGSDLVKIQSVATGKVLDVARASTDDGAPIVQWDWHGGLNQQWRAMPFSALTPGGASNLYLFVSASSGKVLDVEHASQDSGAPLIQWPWQATPNQMWVQAFLP